MKKDGEEAKNQLTGHVMFKANCKFIAINI